MEGLFLWGITIVLALQAFSTPALDGASLALTQLGGEEVALLIVPLVYWCLDKRFGVRLAYLFLLSFLANVWLKALFNTPRPYQYDPRVRLIGSPPHGSAFPSGHAKAATTMWGALAARVRRPPMWAVAATVIALVSLSRIYLGVHFPHDAAGGIAFGVIALLIFARIEPAVSVRLASLSFGAQITLSLVASLALLMVFIDRDSVTGSAVLAGLGIGYAMQRRWASFSVSGSAGQRALRFALGLVGVAAIYLCLRVAFGAIATEEDTPLWYVLRFARYGLTGVWAGGLWPIIAVKLGLANDG